MIAVNYQNRFNPAIAYLFELLHNGTLGEVRFFSGTLRWWRDSSYFGTGWRGKQDAAGGMLYNQGSHLINIMYNVCGPIRKVTAVKKKMMQDNVMVDDMYLGLIEFENGALGNLELTTHTKFKSFESAIFLICENGSIAISGNSLNKLEFISLHDKRV